MSFLHLISDLVRQYDCVVIPGFGGFVGNQHGSVHNAPKETFLPPHKHVLFNVHLIHNDGLLAHHLAFNEKISYKEALNKIEQEVDDLKFKLHMAGRVEVPKLGYLESDLNRKINFVFGNEGNLLLDSYGLRPLHLKEVMVPVIEEEESTDTPIISIDQSKESIQPKRRFKWVRVAAAACILPFLFYSYWIPVHTDVLRSGHIELSDLNPFSEKEKSIQSFEPAGIKKLEFPVEEVVNPDTHFTWETPEGEEIKLKIRKNTPLVTSPDVHQFSSGKLHAIVGCFSKESNAVGMVEELKGAGFSAHILDVKGGLFRVSAGSAESQREMKGLRDRISNLGKSSWVLKVK